MSDMMMDDIQHGMKVADELRTKRQDLPISMVPMLCDVAAELERASKWPGFNSAHEGYGVLAEEVDELLEATGLEQVTSGVNRLWLHVKVNQKRRDLVAMRAEAIQVAAMALKFVQMIDAGRGRV